MPKRSAPSLIRLRGIRHNNLKNFDLDLPAGRLIVITGPSGSGKSSLAFDTLYAEGQRRYIETFSPYARQFFDRMDKPQVDSVEGIPPAIAIEQRNTVKTTRSTVGTMTEICDYMRVVWTHLSQLNCRQCARPVRKDSPEMIWRTLESFGGLPPRDEVANGERNRAYEIETRGSRRPESVENEPVYALHEAAPTIRPEVLIAFDLALSEKISIADTLALVSKQGYQRLLLPLTSARSETREQEFEILRIDEAAGRLQEIAPRQLTILQDRLALTPSNRSRFVDGCEQAYHFGRGKLTIIPASGGEPRRYSNRLHCAECDLEYREPSPALFSFNHPVGACPTCRGFGRTITIDYNLAIPDKSLAIAEGVIKPWQSGQSAECQDDLLKFCKLRKIPIHVPFRDLSKTHQDWVLNGDPGYGKDKQHEWPRAWYGVKGYFRWLESRSYKMHVRVLLSRYRSYQTCADCKGARFQPEALLFKIRNRENAWLTLADFYQLPSSIALDFIETLVARHKTPKTSDPLFVSLNEVRARLRYLNDVGLGYLTLDRATRTLSGGETERVSLTTCLGSNLVNTMFVLDEPSVGLHSRDTARLVELLERLRDAGNTVVVVEHEASVMRAADQIVDLGPGHGESGGHLVFQGPFKSILQSRESLTGQYLSGRKEIEIPRRRPVTPTLARLILSRANLHNLRDLTVEVPLGRLVCVTGVSGSGKSTLVRGILMPALEAKLRNQNANLKNSDSPNQSKSAIENSDSPVEEDSNATISDHPTLGCDLTGAEHLGRAVMVDQSPIGKTPRSTPAVYVGAFDYIRELFAKTELARQRGLKESAFSFNSSQGQCERCRGAGFEKIEMQFLSDVFVRCPECDGRRYRAHILEIELSPSNGNGRNIADLLRATVDEGIAFIDSFTNASSARKAVSRLKLLAEVGLGYLRMGQPINTLSGGECQRLKLVSHLADFTEANETLNKPTLFLFDEPTTGLHFEDIAVLLRVFQRLVNAGHSVVIIEHNLDVIKCADWIIDLGPEAGEGGGKIVIQGTPEEVAACAPSHTGRALRELAHVTASRSSPSKILKV